MFVSYVKRPLTTAGLASLLIASGPTLAQDFSLSCQLVDPATGAERQVFAAGESFAINYGISVPPVATGQEIHIKISARARIAGVPLAYAIDEVKLSLPNQAVATEEPDAGVLPGTTDEAGQFVGQIPNGFPAGSATVRAKASIEGLGNRACELTLDVANPT